MNENKHGFYEIEPLADIAEIEKDGNNQFPQYKGKVWVNSNWLDKSHAVALRDWLNNALGE